MRMMMMAGPRARRIGISRDGMGSWSSHTPAGSQEPSLCRTGRLRDRDNYARPSLMECMTCSVCALRWIRKCLPEQKRWDEGWIMWCPAECGSRYLSARLGMEGIISDRIGLECNLNPQTQQLVRQSGIIRDSPSFSSHLTYSSPYVIQHCWPICSSNEFWLTNYGNPSSGDDNRKVKEQS